MKDDRLLRRDEHSFRVANPFGVDATLFANADVSVESVAISELDIDAGIAADGGAHTRRGIWVF